MTEARQPSERPEPPAWLRWLVLFVISLAMFGNYFFYDLTAGLADVLRDQLGFTDEKIGSLNTMYSAVNVVMVFIGGLVIDRIGTRKATMLFGLMTFSGALLSSISPNFTSMMSGRLLFGMGAESLIVAVTTALAKWFKGKRLSLAFGLNLSIARLGSLAAENAPTWAKEAFTYWQTPLLIGVGVCSLCVIAPLVYWILESRAERSFHLGQAGETDKVALKDVLRFPASFWFVVALCFTFYSGIFPFKTFVVKQMQDVHGLARNSAAFLNSLVTLSALVCTPLLGFLADRYGRRASAMVLSCVLLLPVYLLLTVSSVPPFVPMMMMGISFSLIPAVMWPSVAYLVKDSQLGTAYGVMTALQNIGLGGFNYLIGKVNTVSAAGPENPSGYTTGMWIFTVLAVVGLACAFLLLRSERGPNARGLETITTRETK